MQQNVVALFKKLLGIWLAAVAVLVFGLVLLAAYWPGSDGVLFGLLGDGVDYRDAYAANEQTMDRRTKVTPEQERLRLAEAQVDSPMPSATHLGTGVGGDIGARIHTPPMLATLKYETFDADGQASASWQVRALVPPVFHTPSTKARVQCRKACRNALVRRDSTQIVRSGEAGVAGEWLLRMPLNKPMRLSPPPTDVQDILDERRYNIPLVTPKGGDGRSWRQPTVQVTLLSACRADVNIGTRKEFELAEYAPIPIITGMRTTEWLELRGCGQLKPVERPPDPPPKLPPDPPSPQPGP